MKHVCEKLEKNQVKITLTLEKEDWENSIHRAYLKEKNRFSVPGFRKGHVPFNVICRQYGKDVFYEDALNLAIQEYYPQVLASEPELHAVGDPDIKLGSFGEDEVVLEFVVPVMPEVAIEAYKGIKIKKVEYNVSDEDVQRELDNLQRRNVREVSVTDREAKDGDNVNIDFSGSVDGKKFDGGTAQGYKLKLGSHSFVPGFEEQIVGMKIGEEKDISIKFPDDYVEDLKGKDAIFAVKLNAISFDELPEITDEFIKDAVGEESVEAYKVKIREDLQKRNDKKSKDETEDKLLEAIAEKTTVDIHDVMIDNEVTNMVRQLEYTLMYQGIKLEDYLKMTGQDEKKLRDGYRETAASRVKKQLIVNKIIELEGIKAEQAEIDQKVAEQAASVSKDVEEYRKTMDSRQFEYIENSIIVDKLFAFLTANNVIE